MPEIPFGKFQQKQILKRICMARLCSTALRHVIELGQIEWDCIYFVTIWFPMITFGRSKSDLGEKLKLIPPPQVL